MPQAREANLPVPAMSIEGWILRCGQMHRRFTQHQAWTLGTLAHVLAVPAIRISLTRGSLRCRLLPHRPCSSLESLDKCSAPVPQARVLPSSHSPRLEKASTAFDIGAESPLPGDAS